MPSLGDVTARLVANAGSFNSELDKSTRQVRALAASAKQVQEALDRMAEAADRAALSTGRAMRNAEDSSRSLAKSVKAGVDAVRGAGDVAGKVLDNLSSKIKTVVNNSGRIAAVSASLSTATKLAGTAAGLTGHAGTATALGRVSALSGRSAQGFGMLATAQAARGVFAREGVRGLYDMARGTKEAGDTAEHAAGQIGMMGDVLRQTAIAAVAFGAGKAAWNWLKSFTQGGPGGLIGGAVAAGARLDELNATMALQANNAGVTKVALDAQVESLKDLGIETSKAQDAIAQFTKSGLDMSKLSGAGGLADVARNAAIFAKKDTSETLSDIIYGIQTRQIEVLRSSGINISFENAYAQYAATLGKAVTNLSETEKAQIALNAVLKEGKNLTGAYDAAMTTAGKQIRSTPRYLQELKNAMGAGLQPVFRAAVSELNDWIQFLTTAFGRGTPASTMIIQWATTAGNAITGFSEKARAALEGVGLDRLFSKVGDLVKAMSGFGSVGAAGIAAAAAQGSGMLGPLGRFLGPISATQAALVTFIATNRNARDALGTLVDAAADAGRVVSQALLPVVRQFADTLNRNSGVLETLAESVARFVSRASYMAAAIIDVVGALVSMGTAIGGVVAGLGDMLGFLGPVSRVMEGLGQNMTVVAAAATILGSRIFAVVGIATKTFAVLKGLEAVQGMAAAARSATTAQEAMRGMGAAAAASATSWKNFAAAATRAAIGVTAVLTVLTFAWAKQQREIDETTARVKAHWAAYAEANGAEAALRGIAVELDRTSEAVKKTQHWWEMFAPDFGDISGSKSRGAKTDDKATKAAWDEQWKAYQQSVAQFAAATKQALTDTQDDVSQAASTITRRLGAETGGMVNYANLTATQAKKLEDVSASLKELTARWADDITSLSGALLDKEVYDFRSLQQWYGVQQARLRVFWVAISELANRGLNQSALDSLIAAGPEKMAGALFDVLQEARNRGPAAFDEFVNFINAQTTNAAALIDANVKELSQRRFLKEALAPTLSAEEKSSIEREIADQASSLRDAITRAQTVAFAVGRGNEGAQGDLNAWAANYEAAVKVILDLQSTATQRAAAIQAVIAAGDRAIATGMSEGDAAVINELTGTLVAYQSFGPKLQQAATIIGKETTERLATGLGLGNPAVAAAGAAAGATFARAMANALVVARRTLLNVFSGAGVDFGPSFDVEVQKVFESSTGALTAAQKESAAAANNANMAYTDLVAAYEKAGIGGGQLNRETAELADSMEDVAQRVRDAYGPLEQFRDALDQVYGNFLSWQSAADRSADASDDLAQKMIELSTSTDSPARKSRQLRGEVERLIGALRSETEAAAEAGVIGKDVASMTEYLRRRVGELTRSIPDLVREFQAGTKALDQIDEALGKVRDQFDRTLTLKINVGEAAAGTREAFRNLDRTVRDSRALLTGVFLSSADRQELQDDMTGGLNDYVRALQDEAEAQARAGKIGSDAASITKFIRDRLIQLRTTFPELVPVIDDYTRSLNEIQPEKETKVSLETLVGQSFTILDDFKTKIGDIPRVAEILLQAKIDEERLAAAKQRLKDEFEPSTLFPDPISPIPANPPAGFTAEDNWLTRAVKGIKGEIDKVNGAPVNVDMKEVGSKAVQAALQAVKKDADNIPNPTTVVSVKDDASLVLQDVHGQITTIDSASAMAHISANVDTGGFMVADSWLSRMAEKARLMARGNEYLALAANAASDGTWVSRALSTIYSGTAAAWFAAAASYDSGGVLKPGATMAHNATGRDEYVLTPQQLGAVAGMRDRRIEQLAVQVGRLVDQQGGPRRERTTIGTMVVQSNEPPQRWFEEAMWRRWNGAD